MSSMVSVVVVYRKGLLTAYVICCLLSVSVLRTVVCTYNIRLLDIRHRSHNLLDHHG